MEHSSQITGDYISGKEQRLAQLRQRERELNEECVRIAEDIEALTGESVSAVCVLSET
jgi:hypothetical protein